MRRDYLEIDVEGASTEVPELVGVQQPDLLLLNDDDLAYAKIRLDERSLATAIVGARPRFEDSLAARARVGRRLGHDPRRRDARHATSSTSCWRNIGAETDAWAVTRIPSSTALAVNFYSDPAHRAELRAHVGVRACASCSLAAEPGSDHQLTFARSYAGAAHSDAALDDLDRAARRRRSPSRASRSTRTCAGR